MKQKRGGQTRVAAQPGSGAWFTRSVLAILLGAASLSSCLVTQEVEYDAPDSPPRISRMRPADSIVRVPYAPDTDCENEKGMAFEVRVADRDREQDLYAVVYLNGEYQRYLFGPVPPSTDGTDERSFVRRCVRLDSLNLSSVRCNQVMLAVSSSAEKLNLGPNGLELDPDWAAVEWTVLKSSLIDPQVSASECPAPLVDAGALFGEACVLLLEGPKALPVDAGARP